MEFANHIIAIFLNTFPEILKISSIAGLVDSKNSKPIFKRGTIPTVSSYE